jgi:hypothetical protein
LLFKELCERDPDGLRDMSGWLNVGDSLFALQSRDHHDWFLEFAKSRGLEAGQLFMILFTFWLKAGNNEEEAKTAFDAIRKKIEQEGAKVEVNVSDGSHLVAVLEVVETGIAVGS